MQKSLCCIVIFSFFSLSNWAQYLIEGRVDTPFIYPLVHLDILNDWDAFNTVSDVMTIKSTPINDKGYFKFEGNELSDKRGFYRVRYTKLNQPVSITSQPRNFIVFNFSNLDTIQIERKTFIPNNKANQNLIKLITKNDAFEQAFNHPENELHERLLQSKYAAFCTQVILTNEEEALNKMYCLYNADLKVAEHLNVYKKVHQALATPSIRSTYYQSLAKPINAFEVASIKKIYRQLSLILYLSLFANIIFLVYFLRKKFKKKKDKQTVSNLTAKEMEVLQLIIGKKSNKEIAGALFVSDATIKTHINNIYRKLGVNSRKQVIQRYQTQKSTPV